MWCLKHKLRWGPEWDRETKDYLDIYQSKISHRLMIGGLTVGSSTDKKEETDPSTATYSASLRALINECLLIQTASRPSPEILVARTKRGLERARENASVPPYVPPTSVPPQIEPSSRWFSQDPFLSIKDKSELPHTLRISDLPQKITRARIEKARDKDIGARQRGWVSRLNLKFANTRLYRPGDSDPFAGIAGLANMRHNINLSIPLGIGADIAAGVAAGIGAGVGAGLGMVKGHVQAGFNAGANRLADAINPPLPPRNNDAWEILSRNNISHIPESGRRGQPPDAEALAAMPTLHCIVRVVGAFGAVTHTIVKLNGFYKGTTIFQLKGALKANGVDIPLHKMKITVGIRTLEDHHTLLDLGGRTNLRVEELQ
jgi:hypothetical protein